MKERYDEIIAEIEAPNNARMDEIRILIKSSKGYVLEPQVILDSVVDLLLINYGPFLDDHLPNRLKGSYQ